MSVWGVCDVCGEPATSVARDVIVVTRAEDAYERYEASGTIKRGCDEHPAESYTKAIQSTRMATASAKGGVSREEDTQKGLEREAMS